MGSYRSKCQNGYGNRGSPILAPQKMLELTCETTDMKVTEHRSGIGTSLFYAIGGAVGADLCRPRLRDYWAG